MIALDEMKDLILDCGLEYREEDNECAYGYYNGYCVVIYFRETAQIGMYDKKSCRFVSYGRDDSNAIEKVRQKIEEFLELNLEEKKLRKEAELCKKIAEIQNCGTAYEC